MAQDDPKPEDELQHLKEVNQPEDFAHPEPDEAQREAREPAHGLHWMLPLVVVVIVVVGLGFYFFSR